MSALETFKAQRLEEWERIRWSIPTTEAQRCAYLDAFYALSEADIETLVAERAAEEKL